MIYSRAAYTATLYRCYQQQQELKYGIEAQNAHKT